MTPTTISRPRALLRAAVAALGVCLAVLAAMNLFVVGRSATDENVFINPLSAVYVVEHVAGERGPQRSETFALVAGFIDGVEPVESLEPGDILAEINRRMLSGTDEARERIAGQDRVEVTAYRASTRRLVSVIVPAAGFMDAVRSISKTVVVTQVTPGGASDRAGMLPGDVITRINGQGFANDLDADRLMRASHVGRVSEYEVLRNGEPLTLEVRLSAFGIGIAALLLAIVGLLYIVGGTLLATYRTHIKAAYYLGLAWMGTGYTIAVALNRPRRTLPTWYLFTSDFLLSCAAGLGVAFWLHSMRYFPRERPGLVRRRWAITGGYVLAILLAVVGLALIWGRPSNIDGVPYATAIIMVSYAAIASAGTHRSYSPEDRQISRPTSIATSLAVGFMIGPIVVGVLGRLMGLSLGIAPASVAQGLNALVYLAVLVVYLLVIGRYHLLELDLRVRRNVQYLLVSSAWTLLVVGAGLWFWWRMMHLELSLPNVRLTSEAIEVLPTPVDPARRALVEKGVLIAAAVVFAYAFRSLLKRGHRFLAEQYYQEGHDYRRATRELGEIMGPRLDLDGLADGVLTVIDRLMPLKRAGLVFVQGPRLVSSKRSVGFEPEDWAAFCGTCAEEAVQVLRAARGAELDAEYAPPRLRLALRRAQIHHLYPIGGHDELRGVIFIGEKLSEAAYNADDSALLGVIASQASLLVENAFLYENLAAQERARQELAIARRIQLESLPQHAPTVAGLEVFGMSIPAQEVGGDYFDYLESSEGHLTVMIGDVSGKGTSAALYMSKLQGVVRSLHGFGLTPRQLFVRTNALLGRDMERRSFVTALGVFFDTTARTITIARAGHLPLYHYEAETARVRRWLPRGLGLGLSSSTLFESELEERQIPYAPGDVFLLVTDGIVEGQGDDQEEFGETRLVDLFTSLANAATPVEGIVQAINAAAAEHAGSAPQHDDQTVVVIRAR
ncbi:MAG: SpoIIE family protein phosphatase [Acidobacteria bacterium]|nr:SpoIIE family protein phosphatase [Acidobacteriota bacterium]